MTQESIKPVINIFDFQSGDNPELQYLKKVIDRQEQEIVGLSSQVDKLTDSLNESQSLLSLPTDERLQKCIDRLKLDIEDLKSENVCLRRCLAPTSPAEEESAGLQLELLNNNVLRAEIEALKKQLEELECYKTAAGDFEKLEVVRREYIELKMKYVELEARFSDSNSKEIKAKLERTQKEKSELHIKLDETIHKSVMQETEAIQEMCQLRDTIKATEKENKNLKTALEQAIKSRKLAATDQINYLHNKVNSLEMVKLDLETRLSNHKSRLHGILEKLEQNIAQNSIQKEELESEIRTIKSRNDQLEDLNKAMEHQLSACTESLDNLTNCKIIELETQNINLEEDKIFLNEKLNLLTKDQNDIIEKFNGSSFKHIDLESEIMTLTVKLKKHKSSIVELENEVKEANNNAFAVEKREKLKQSELEMQFDIIRSQKKAAEKERDLITAENNELVLRIGNLHKNSAKLQCDSEKLGHILRENQNIKNELEVTKNQFHSKLFKEKIQVETLKNEKDQLKLKITELVTKLQVNDQIDSLLQERREEKETLIENIKHLGEQLQECEVKNMKLVEELQEKLEKQKEENVQHETQKKKELQDLQDEYEQNLNLAKDQYNKDILFVRGRHNERINQLQSMHEESVDSKVEEFELQIEDLKSQKQSYRESLRSKRNEIDELQIQLKNKKREYEYSITGMKNTMSDQKKKTDEKIETLAKKCWEELEKVKSSEKHTKLLQIIYEQTHSGN